MGRTIPEVGFLRLRQIVGRPGEPGIFPVSKSAWWSGIKEGRYPAPVRLGPRTVAWTVESIRALIEALSTSEQAR